MKRFLLFFIIAIILAASAFAQSAGRLTGSVVDQTGASVPGATVNVYLSDGKAVILTTTTTPQGDFHFAAVRPATYRVEIEQPGFRKYVQTGVKIDTARETAIPAVTLELASSTAIVEVSAAVASVETTNAEVASTVRQSQVTNLPVPDRQLTSLIYMQPGVTTNMRSVAVINGVRPSYTNVTLDGINLQDSVRTNAIDYMPNKLTISQVEELTVSTSNANLTIGGGASTVAMTTPSGTNQLHGKVYWYNRNNKLAANDYFNNMSGTSLPTLNLNQVGADAGGPIVKDKLFYFGTYETYRMIQSSPQTYTILTPEARNGIFRYKDANGAVLQYNVLAPWSTKINPAIQTMLDKIPSAGNTTTVGDGLNTTGYQFNQRDNTRRDNVTGKMDYNLSPSHTFSGSYTWNRDIVDRPDYTGSYDYIPPISNNNRGHLMSVAWRWSPSATLTNEVRGGFAHAPSVFNSSQADPAYFTSGTLFTAPVVARQPEGRTVNTYILQDNATWVHGKHQLNFGYQMNMLRTSSFNFTSTIPTYTISLNSSNIEEGFGLGDIPGANSNYINTANNLLATLGGFVSASSQTFNATSPTSGYVTGASNNQNVKFNQYALYLADTYRIRRNWTLTLGVRWDYFAPVEETNGLLIQPVLQNNNPIETLMGNMTLDMYGGSTGRALYAKDKNNFAPNIAFAWDVFGNGRTAIRGGYNIAFVNDNAVNSIQNTTTYINPGLSTSFGYSNMNSKLGENLTITPPKFEIPITAQTLFDANPYSVGVFGMVDPNLRTPYVQQWNFGIQQELKGFVLEARYVGNHAVKMFRNLDMNQINPVQQDFLADFNRARNNGFLALQNTGAFNPAYNSAIPGSQPLTFFNKLPGSGALTNSTVRTYIRQGEIGTLAQLYQQNLYFPNDGFSYFPNPLALYETYMTNFSHSTFNSAQFEVRKRTSSGFQFAASYVFSKALSDAVAFRGLDPLLDNNNPQIEKSRPTFDMRHGFKMNHVTPLPFGTGRRFDTDNPILSRLVSGWSASGILFIQSGSPVAIYSARGTLNRGARSGSNTIDTNLDYAQLQTMIGTYINGGDPRWFNPKYLGVDGRAVAGDGETFANQVFFQPQAGSVGSLQRRLFDGPMGWNYNFSLIKNTKIAERYSVDLRADFYNIFNHANFYIGDQTVTSASFGKYAGQNYSNDGIGPRQLQLSLQFRF